MGKSKTFSLKIFILQNDIKLLQEVYVDSVAMRQ